MKRFQYYIFSLLLIIVSGSNHCLLSQEVLATGPNALHRGIYEIILHTRSDSLNPYFQTELKVTFTRPDQSTVTVDGFYDGGLTFKARAYCDQVGVWKWRSASSDSSLVGHKGSFEVVPSDLRGKLRISEKDPYQFAYDNGEWFLHIGDTGYRFLIPSEPYWREYIDQAAQMGATKIRAWFAMSRGTVEHLFTTDRKNLALYFWKEMDRRILYTLRKHPQINLQLIPFAEDTERIKAYYHNDSAAQLIMQYAQARWSAMPNIQWTMTNDRAIIKSDTLKGRQVHYDMIDKIGKDMDQKEPWNTLITNHQARFTGYDFVNASWSDIITLEDLDQVAGELILEYRNKGKQPVVLDEDRYELYRYAAHRRYFFRRLMWANLLSGGHATYGGLKTYEPYNGQVYSGAGVRMAYQPHNGVESGIRGYYDANQEGILFQGAHDFKFIHQFFREAGITLENKVPNDAMAGGDPLKWKCTGDEKYTIIYLANPSGNEPGTDYPLVTDPSVTVILDKGQYLVKWFDPDSGSWFKDRAVTVYENKVEFKAPGPEDWVLLLEKN